MFCSIRAFPEMTPKRTLSASSLLTMSERGGALAQERLYKDRSGWRQRTQASPELSSSTLDAHTLLLKVRAALFAKPANLSEPSKRYQAWK